MKKTMLITAGLLGFGGYLLYKSIKQRTDNLEEEIWSMEESDLEDCPYCDKVYNMEDEENEELKEKVDEFNSRRINCENCTDVSHKEMQSHLDNVKDDKVNTDINMKDYVDNDYEQYDEEK